MKKAVLSIFKIPMIIVILCGICAFSFLFYFMHQADLKESKQRVADHISNWNYQMSDDIHHRNSIEVVKKVARDLKMYPINSYEFVAQGKSVLKWPKEKNSIGGADCVLVEKSLMLSAGIKLGSVKVCLSESRIIRKTLFSPLLMVLGLGFFCLLALSSITPLFSYKSALDSTIKALKDWRDNPEKSNFSLTSSDKITSEIISLASSAVETKVELKSLKGDFEIEKNFSQIIRQLAHDIRSPADFLVHVLPHIVKDKNSSEAKLAEVSLKSILETSEDLLKQKKNQYRLRKTTFEEMDSLIGPILDQKRRKNPQIFFDFGNETDKLGKCYAPDFKRVFSNIINNSIEAALKTDKPCVFCEVKSSSADFIEIQVTDNGKGIREDHLEKVFKENFTFGKSNGNGLGLFDAKNKVESWGGNIKISSKQGVGTTVVLILKSYIEKQKSLEVIS